MMYTNILKTFWYLKYIKRQTEKPKSKQKNRASNDKKISDDNNERIIKYKLNNKIKLKFC